MKIMLQTMPPGLRQPLSFALAFLAVFAVLYGLYAMTRGTTVERLVIDEWTVSPGVTIINLLTPAEAVKASGHRLVSNKARLSVLNGCEGTESLFLLVAAITAFGATWRAKAVGILAGTALIFVLNQIRIVSLYYALRHERAWFEALHGYIAPTLIVFAGALFFLWWVSRVARPVHVTATAD